MVWSSSVSGRLARRGQHREVEIAHEGAALLLNIEIQKQKAGSVCGHQDGLCLWVLVLYERWVWWRHEPKGKGRLKRMQVLSVKEAEFRGECITFMNRQDRKDAPYPKQQVLSLPNVSPCPSIAMTNRHMKLKF